MRNIIATMTTPPIRWKKAATKLTVLSIRLRSLNIGERVILEYSKYLLIQAFCPRSSEHPVILLTYFSVPNSPIWAFLLFWSKDLFRRVEEYIQSSDIFSLQERFLLLLQPNQTNSLPGISSPYGRKHFLFASLYLVTVYPTFYYSHRL